MGNESSNSIIYGKEFNADADADDINDFFG